MILLSVQVCATLGTTGACSFDNLMEIGPICELEIYLKLHEYTLNKAISTLDCSLGLCFKTL